MRTQQRLKTLLVVLLAFAGLVPAGFAQTGVPNVFPSNETEFQKETHFLTFIGSFIPESATTAKAYYKAIDPYNAKPTFQQWLVNAGFISNSSQWHPSGPQKIACNLPGCDFPAGTYGDNIINTDSHAIVLNAADLGFVRNQFVRCVPSCTAPNPIIYTYLENYPVAPYATTTHFGTPNATSAYPAPDEATRAIQNALMRPLGDISGNPTCGVNGSGNPSGTCRERIADVAFEWAPPATNPTSSTRYGQLYAYIFRNFGGGNTAETIAVPPDLVGKSIPNFATGAIIRINAGDPFPPNLDGLGFKQHPGVCFICHGGKPTNLTSTGQYPRQGRVDGFRFLPLDIANLLFTSDAGSETSSRSSQELHIKSYNQAVLATVPTYLESDGTGSVRQAHLREVITGWYTDPGGQPFARTTQNTQFLPVGWRDATHGGTAPTGSSDLYIHTVAPSCRSCHFNRELSLDFGTAANFQQESDLMQLAVLPDCSSLRPGIYSPDPNLRPMPLAHLTFQRLWQANATSQTLPFPAPGIQLINTVENLATYFRFNGTSGYCASNP